MINLTDMVDEKFDLPKLALAASFPDNGRWSQISTFQPYLFQRGHTSPLAPVQVQVRAAKEHVLTTNPLLQNYVKKLTVTFHVATDPLLPLLLESFTSLNSLLLASFTSGIARVRGQRFIQRYGHPLPIASIRFACILPPATPGSGFSVVCAEG
ncbi:hypothetical protein MD484_g8233, partial [Candolleomyces efflorescens]